MGKDLPLSPVPPKLTLQLDDWQGPIASELELEKYVVDGADFSGVRKLEIDGCSVVSAVLTGADISKLRCSDAKLAHIEAAGLRAADAQLLRTHIKSSRMTGIDLGQSQLEDCTFESVKLDEAGLRFAHLKRVIFKDCVLKQADFTGATLTHVSFIDCALEGTNFDRAACAFVDMRGENLAVIKGVNGLKGVHVSNEQLVELAPLMALELGLDVSNET